MKRLLTLGSVSLLLQWGTTVAQEAHVLTKDELSQILPSSTVVSTDQSGVNRRWTNEPDGKFFATGSVIGRGLSFNAPGDWHISDDGKYCVHIEWNRMYENWCALVQRTDGRKYTLVESGSSGTLPQSIEITSK
jgi:hypothetical protein